MTPTLIVDENGTTNAEKSGKSVKQLFFDWSSVVAIGIAAITWGVTTNRIDNNTKEIERLRLRDDARVQSDIKIAADMATKTDVQRVSDKLDALANELRNARINK